MNGTLVRKTEIPTVGDQVEVWTSDSSLYATVTHIVSPCRMTVDAYVWNLDVTLRMYAVLMADGRWRATATDLQVEAFNTAL